MPLLTRTRPPLSVASASEALRAERLRAVTATALTAALALALGAGLALGGLAAAAAIAICAGVFVLLLFERLGFHAITAWVVLGGLALPFIRFPQTHAVITSDRVWIPLTLIALLHGAARRRSAPATARLSIAMGLFVAAFGVRAALSPSHRLALELWFDAILLPAILYWVVRRSAATPERLHALTRGFVWAGVLLGLLAIFERVTGYQLATRYGGTPFLDPTVGVRVSGPYSQPNILSVVLLICLAMTLYWIQLRGRAVLTLGILAVAIELAGIGITFFRGAYIAAAVVIIVSFGLRPRRYARLLGVTGLIAALALAGLSALQSSALSSRLNNTSNVSGRIATYQVGEQLFVHHPLLGVGVAQFGAAQLGGVGSASVGGIEAVSTAHNSFVDVIAEQGLLGGVPLLLLTLTIWQLIRTLSRKARSRDDVILAACIAGAALAFLIMAMELTTILQSPSNAMFAVCLGMAAARLDSLTES